MSNGVMQSLWLWLAMGMVVLAIAGPSTVRATAPAPPALVPALLIGEPIQVLYITRANDTVLVRCYPGYIPTWAGRPRSDDADSDPPPAGMLSCAILEPTAAAS